MTLVDTSVWSLALRRRPGSLSINERRLVDEWKRLVEKGLAVLIGPIRQEILSGIRERSTFETLRGLLSSFRYFEIVASDYDRAAEFFNDCRANGISGGHVDLLISSVAHRLDVPVFTADPDFVRYARHVPLRLHKP
jgi:predicted nucleic acid-binding protein